MLPAEKCTIPSVYSQTVSEYPCDQCYYLGLGRMTRDAETRQRGCIDMAIDVHGQVDVGVAEWSLERATGPTAYPAMIRGAAGRAWDSIETGRRDYSLSK